LLHPFMPFLTEELWQRLPQKPGVVKAKSSIMVADYPTVIQEWRNEEAEAEMAVIEAIVRATRSLRMVYDLQPRIRPELYVMCKTSEMATLVRKTTSEIGTLALSSSVQVCNM
jgi:valyl-tRNA synthetase